MTRNFYGYYAPITITLENTTAEYHLITDSQEVEHVLDNVDFPKEYRKEITAALVKMGPGMFTTVWFSESPAPYKIGAYYHNLAYYL